MLPHQSIHSLWQRHFYTTFSWGVRKYCSWKRRVEATEQIKDKNLPVRKISVSLNEKFLEVPMSCFALRKSWRGKIQINEHKIEKLDFRPGWYLWRLSVLESGLHFCSWTCFLAYLAPTCNPIYSVTSKMASGLSLHHIEEVGNFGVKFTVVTALTCWKQLQKRLKRQCCLNCCLSQGFMPCSFAIQNPESSFGDKCFYGLFHKSHRCSHRWFETDNKGELLQCL